jgi:hypothetical protein
MFILTQRDEFSPAPVLPTGRIFGSITQKGLKKVERLDKFFSRILSDFVMKGPKKFSFSYSL